MAMFVIRLMIFAACSFQSGALNSKSIHTQITKPVRILCTSSSGGTSFCENITTPNCDNDKKLSTDFVRGNNKYFVNCPLARDACTTIQHANGTIDCKEGNTCKLSTSNDLKITCTVVSSKYPTAPILHTKTLEQAITASSSQMTRSPISKTLPKNSRATSISIATLAGAVVGGVLGGVVITLIAVVVWWNCRGKGSDDHVDLTLKTTKSSRRDNKVVLGQAEGNTRASLNMGHDKVTESVQGSAGQGEYIYIAIDDEEITTGGAEQIYTDTQEVESQNKEGHLITYNSVADHSDYLLTHHDRVKTAHLTSDYFVLEDDHETHGTYKKLGATSEPVHQETDTYNRIGQPTTTRYTKSETETDQLTSDYFVLEDDDESQITYNKLGDSSLPVHEEQDTYNRIGKTPRTWDQPEPNLPNHGDGDTLQTLDTYNKLGAPSELAHQE